MDDWVKARAEWTTEILFEQLFEGVSKDVEAAKAHRPQGRCEVKREGARFTLSVTGISPMDVVFVRVFVLETGMGGSPGEINVRFDDGSGHAELTARAALDDELSRRVRVTDRRGPQSSGVEVIVGLVKFRRMILEPLLFLTDPI